MAVIATGNRDDALDIVQEAMLKLAHKYSAREESEWGPLFHRIVQNSIMDWHRRQKVRNTWQVVLGFTGFGQVAEQNQDFTDGVGSVGDSVANRGDNPLLKLANEKSIEALDNALNKLPVRQQQAFLLRIWEGLSVEDTALAMSCSQGSVKTHLSRAVHTLREQLEDHRL